MSLSDGMAAINLDMPGRIPRTEYSAEGHWELIAQVTGIPVRFDSDEQTRAQARRAFIKAWNYDFIWSILTHNQIYGELYTKMGHANYAAGNVDYDQQVACPFTDVEQVLSFDFFERYGSIDQALATRQYEEHYRANCADNPDAVNMTGIYVTMFSGLIEIFGWEMLLLAAGESPQRFGELANRYAAWIAQYFEALAQADVPVVMIHDDIVWTSGPFLHPQWYRQYLFPNYKTLFRPVLDSGKKLIYTSDGTYTMFIDDIAASGVNGFVLEPTTDLQALTERYGKTHVIIGNADTRILLSGTREAIYNEVKRCMDLGGDCPGFFMAVGNHIPANTPVDNCLYYQDCYEMLSRR